MFGECTTAMQKHTRDAASALLYSLENHQRYRFSSDGPCGPETRSDLDSVLRTLIHPGLGDARLSTATARLFSGSDGRDIAKRHAQSTVEGGMRLVGDKCPHAIAAELKVEGGDRKRQKRVDAYDFEVLLNYFHDDCPLVEPNKSKMQPWKNKKVRVCGGERRMSCHPRLRKGTKAMCVDEYFMSDICHQYESLNPGVSLTTANAMKCICPCMKVEPSVQLLPPCLRAKAYLLSPPAPVHISHTPRYHRAVG